MKNEKKLKGYETVWTCDFCGKEFKTKKESDQHELICKKNPKNNEIIFRIKKPSSGTIFGYASLFIFIYFIIYIVANANAQNNGLPIRDLLQPQKWFSSEVKKEIIPTPTSPQKITLTPTQIPTPKIIPKTNNNNSIDTNKPPLPVLNGGKIFGLINQYRSSNGLPFLSVSNELCGIAEGRADLMMANKMEAFKKSGTGSHFGFDNVNYSGEGVGENLAANVAKDSDVLTIWKNSPPHNELMLWTNKNGTPITKGCVATRVSEVGSIVVLLVGDK